MLNLSWRLEMNKKAILKNILYLFLAFSVMGVLKNVLATHTSVKAQRKFNRMIRNPKYNLAIVLFYASAKRMRKENKELYEKLQSLKSMFKNTSKVFKYDDADLLFMTVNLARKKNQDLQEMYKIQATPVCMLFKDGYPYKDKAGKLQYLGGFPKRPQLQALINRNFQEDIERNRKRNKEIREKRIEQARARAYYWGGYGGWGYGGWGYGGYWGRPWGWGGYGGWGYGGSWGRRGCCRRCR